MKQALQYSIALRRSLNGERFLTEDLFARALGIGYLSVAMVRWAAPVRRSRPYR